ncbi:unnamed protein product, partial [Ceratitis capitata]
MKRTKGKQPNRVKITRINLKNITILKNYAVIEWQEKHEEQKKENPLPELILSTYMGHIRGSALCAIKFHSPGGCSSGGGGGVVSGGTTL